MKTNKKYASALRISGIMPRMKAALNVLLLAVMISATASGNDTLTLPFTSARSLLLVSVTVDHESKTLIFDTGAERTMINDKRNIERSVTLTVDTRTLPNVPLAFVDLRDMNIAKVHADGVLGQDVLRRFKTVRVDYATNTITLE